MALSTATFTINNFPKGKDLHGNHLALLGTITVATGSYPSNGIPLSFIGHGVYEGIPPIDGYVHSPTTGINYQFDPVNQSLRIFTTAAPSNGVTTAAFAASANFGTAPTFALSANSNQAAASLTIVADASTGANPTITYTFPQAYTKAPVVVISRGNDADLTAGYWTVIDASTTATGCVFTFVGTPTATKSYVLDFIIVDVGNNPGAVVTAANIALSSGWGTAAAPTLSNASSTQSAVSVIVTAGSAATTANPTVTLTFPVPFATPPVFTISDGVIRPTAGYWVFVGSTVATATFQWIGTPTATDVYKFDAVTVTPTAPPLTAAAVTPSSGFGTAPTVAIKSGNEAAFQLSITAQASTGANPTLTIALPVALGGVPVWVVSRGDAQVTAGYWAVVDASSTSGTLVVKYVGTPTAALTYVLNAISATPATGAAELAVGAAIPAAVVSDLIYANVLTSYS